MTELENLLFSRALLRLATEIRFDEQRLIVRMPSRFEGSVVHLGYIPSVRMGLNVAIRVECFVANTSQKSPVVDLIVNKEVNATIREFFAEARDRAAEMAQEAEDSRRSMILEHIIPEASQ